MGPGFGHCPESRRRRIRRRMKFLTLEKERAPVRKKSARREEKTEIEERGEGGVVKKVWEGCRHLARRLAGSFHREEAATLEGGDAGRDLSLAD